MTSERELKICGRECQNEKARQYRKELKNREKPENITCRTCKEVTSDFEINRLNCKSCERARGRKYRQETDTAKIWVENNRERMSELQHNSYEKNKKQIQQKRTERLKTDPIFKKANDHRVALIKLLKSNRNTTSNYVNTNSENLQRWFEFQFTDDMTLENRVNNWCVDHVIPINTFLKGQYSESLILNWMNTRPEKKEINLVKNKYTDKEQCKEHLKNINNYYEKFDMKRSHEDNEYIELLNKIIRGEEIIMDKNRYPKVEEIKNNNEASSSLIKPNMSLKKKIKNEEDELNDKLEKIKII